MDTNILRNFYYINTDAVDNYVSAIDGSLVSEQNERSLATTDKGVSGEVGISALKLSAGFKGIIEKEVTRKTVQNYSAKVQRIYSFLESKGLPFYDFMDTENWPKVQRNFFFEFDVEIRFSKIETLLGSLRNFLPIFDKAKADTGEIILDQDAKNAFSLISLLSEADKQKGMPVELRFINGGDYKLVTYLNPNYLIFDQDSIPKEVTVLCKVHRLLSTTDKVEMINIIPLLERMAINREIRRNIKDKIDSAPDVIKDTVKGPGAIINTIAIYT
jgi:hypothetical protein